MVSIIYSQSKQEGSEDELFKVQVKLQFNLSDRKYSFAHNNRTCNFVNHLHEIKIYNSTTKHYELVSMSKAFGPIQLNPITKVTDLFQCILLVIG